MKILIVDDSKAMRMIVKTELRKAGYGGHTYIEAGNGVEALKLIQTDSPDIILSDWNMPEMNGIQLLTELNRMKSTNNTPEIAFVFITSESTQEMQTQATAGGAKCFITKPFSAVSFKDKLGDMLD